MIRWLIAIAMLLHGVRHSVFVLAAFAESPMELSAAAWLLPGAFTVDSPVGKAFARLWLLAMLGFMVAAVGLILSKEWWPALAVAAFSRSIARAKNRMRYAAHCIICLNYPFTWNAMAPR